MTPDDILELALRVREVMDELAPKWGVPFCNFPRGSCGAAAEMFGTYLFEQFGIDAKYVSAPHREGLETRGSHAWLEIDDLIIDLTYDQSLHDALSTALNWPSIRIDQAPWVLAVPWKKE